MTPTPVDGYDFYISKNVFNPDNQSVSIHVTFPPASTNNFSLKIYNSAGEFIKQLNKPGQSPPTVDSYSWDGTNMDGQKAADGIYIIYLLEPMASREAKVILLR
jgi:flagellar hook assembly protein FlgD